MGKTPAQVKPQESCSSRPKVICNTTASLVECWQIVKSLLT